MKGLNGVNAKLYDLVNNEGDLTQKLDIKSGEFVSKQGYSFLEYIGETNEIYKNGRILMNYILTILMLNLH